MKELLLDGAGWLTKDDVYDASFVLWAHRTGVAGNFDEGKLNLWSHPSYLASSL